MEFMDMLKEWLDLRDEDNDPEEVCNRSLDVRTQDRNRMEDLEHEINKRIRGEL
jgi:hypothetical protein